MRIDKVLIGSGNKGKIEELKKLLKNLDIEVLSLNDMDKKIDVNEDRKTLLENAIKKAKEYAYFYNMPVIADDTGLEIEALNGYPSIYSARFYKIEFGGRENLEGRTKDTANNEKVLRLLKGEKNRKARFITYLVFYIPNEYGVWAEGILNGRIAEKPIGNKGFGYDPIFIPEGYQKTLGEFEPYEKNKISHRSKAVNKLINILKNITR